MTAGLVLGSNARAAVTRGLLIGFVLQGLLIGAVEVVGEPVHAEVAVLASAAASTTAQIPARAQR
jgi:hypothetical protein